jgi:hypothetical protein
MKISFIQTETKTIRVETKRQLDVVCDSRPPANGILIRVCKGLIKMFWKLLILKTANGRK